MPISSISLTISAGTWGEEIIVKLSHGQCQSPLEKQRACEPGCDSRPVLQTELAGGNEVFPNTELSALFLQLVPSRKQRDLERVNINSFHGNKKMPGAGPGGNTSVIPEVLT